MNLTNDRIFSDLERDMENIGMKAVLTKLDASSLLTIQDSKLVYIKIAILSGDVYFTTRYFEKALSELPDVILIKLLKRVSRYTSKYTISKISEIKNEPKVGNWPWVYLRI